jgi:hypothetical protein
MLENVLNMQANYSWRHNRTKASCIYMLSLNTSFPIQNSVSFCAINHPQLISGSVCIWVHGVLRKMETVLLCYWLKRHFERGSPFLFCLWNEMVTTYYTLQEDMPGIDCCIRSTSHRSIRLSCIEFTSWACAVVPWVYFWSRPCYGVYALIVMEHMGKLNTRAHWNEKYCC